MEKQFISLFRRKQKGNKRTKRKKQTKKNKEGLGPSEVALQINKTRV